MKFLLLDATVCALSGASLRSPLVTGQWGGGMIGVILLRQICQICQPLTTDEERVAPLQRLKGTIKRDSHMDGA